MVFEGIVGTTYISDIAVDEIYIQAGECTLPQGIDTFFCGFEDTGVCGYTNEPVSDDLDWMFQQGGSASGHLGPITDHTYGTTAGIFQRRLSISQHFFTDILCVLLLLSLANFGCLFA